MDRRILKSVFLATTGLALAAAAPAHADCPERVELLKQFAAEGQLEDASKQQINDLALQGVESEEACERIVAELEQRLQVEVRGGEVLPLNDQQQAGGGTGGSDQGTGAQQSAGGGQAGSQTGDSGQQAAQSGQGTGQDEVTIGGGLEMPRDQIDAKYGPLAWLTYEEVIGAQVIDHDGDPIAEILALVRDRSTDSFYAVLDNGGGAGVVVPIDRFEIADGDRIAMAGSADDLESMPAYDVGQYEDALQ